MTAEVIVINRQGLAMAADSAVTVQRIGPDGSFVKVYNSANKLFQLSRSQPVAIMTYNTDTFESVPWETLIKEYRRELADTVCGTVEEYGDKFIEHLYRRISDFTWTQEGHFARELAKAELYGVLDETWKTIHGQIIDAAFSESAIGETDFNEFLRQSIRSRTEMLVSAGFFEELDTDEVAQHLDSVIPEWRDFLE